eukprot:TRINITY_DN285_c0_g1_i1.p1 TRINITY_DN285_c0_g1~~TRINITY_DN285_c0_g1_i1.p1  ORF type:complete len:133 (+),score=22.96 TRINITY_DN285_c0_g1_i1:117-515(+)
MAKIKVAKDKGKSPATGSTSTKKAKGNKSVPKTNQSWLTTNVNALSTVVFPEWLRKYVQGSLRYAYSGFLYTCNVTWMLGITFILFGFPIKRATSMEAFYSEQRKQQSQQQPVDEPRRITANLDSDVVFSEK